MPRVLLFVDLVDVANRFRGETLLSTPSALTHGLRRAALVLGAPVAAVAFERPDISSFASDSTIPPDRLRESLKEVEFTLVRIDAEQTDPRPFMAQRMVQACRDALEDSGDDQDRMVCVLVTGDGALIEMVGPRLEWADLHVWLPPGADPLVPKAQRIVRLEDLLDLRRPSQVLFVDLENVAISLSTQGYLVDPARLAERFTTVAKESGELRGAYAYADWQRLPPMHDSLTRSVVPDAQRVFELHGIETRYLVTIPGKNSADMRIADHVRDLLEREPPSRFILATGDRDFSPVMTTLVSRGCDVMVWGVQGCTSPSLRRIASVRYIHDFVPLTSRTESTSVAALVSPVQSESPLPSLEASRPSIWTSVILHVDDMMRRNGWTWLSQARLATELVRVRELASDEAAARSLLSQGLARGIVRRERIQNPNPNFPDQFTWACRFHDEHPLVVTARLVPQRCYQLLQHHLTRMPYVAFSYLAQSMAKDPELGVAWLGLDDDARALWINYLVAEGRIALTKRPHHRNPNDLVSALTIVHRGDSGPGVPTPWVLPRATDGTVDDPLGRAETTPEAQERLLDDMRRRTFVSIDSFTLRSQLPWAPIITLRQRLIPFGREEAEQVLRASQAAGDLVVQEYPNPHRPYPTRGASLNRESPTVRRVLDERDEVIRQLAQSRQELGSVSADALLFAGAGQQRADLWLSILQQERIVLPERFQPGESPRYALDLGHPVVFAALQCVEQPQPSTEIAPACDPGDHSPQAVESA